MDTIFQTGDGLAEELFNPSAILATRTFHCMYKVWAVLNPIPEQVLDGLQVVCIMHNKRIDSTEHEFLVIETVDRQEEKRLFILERTVKNEDTSDTPCQRPSIYEKLKNLAEKVYSKVVKSDSNESRLEQGKSLTSFKDDVTLLFAQSADLVSDSIDKSPATPANDRFLGERYVITAKWQGENMRYIKLNRLSLYDLALLANAVHNIHPTYELLQNQCYYFADIVFNAVEQHFGVCAEDANKIQDGLVYVDGSCLSNKYGRWRGVMINKTRPEDISLAIKTYKEARTEDMKFVNL